MQVSIQIAVRNFLVPREASLSPFNPPECTPPECTVQGEEQKTAAGPNWELLLLKRLSQAEWISDKHRQNRHGIASGERVGGCCIGLAGAVVVVLVCGSSCTEPSIFEVEILFISSCGYPTPWLPGAPPSGSGFAVQSPRQKRGFTHNAIFSPSCSFP